MLGSPIPLESNTLFFLSCKILLTNLLPNHSVEAARSVMYETELGVFSAFLTNNQARRLSSELNPN
jgi:hypothetical protein